MNKVRRLVRDMVQQGQVRADLKDDMVEPLIGPICARYGYGAVMDAAARLWRQRDPVGAFLVGPCIAVAEAALMGEEHE